MQCLTSCWRLVDWQKDSLDLASRVSSILLELCELEMFLLSWPGPSQSSSPGSSPGKYSSGHSRSCHCHCIGGHFLWIDCYVNIWEVVFVFWKPWTTKNYIGFFNGIQNEKYLPQKTLLFYLEDGFHPKKIHGLSEEPNPFELSRSNPCFET